jgi:hypothetical protein
MKISTLIDMLKYLQTTEGDVEVKVATEGNELAKHRIINVCGNAHVLIVISKSAFPL